MKTWINSGKDKIMIFLLAGILLLVIAIPTEQKVDTVDLEAAEQPEQKEVVSKEESLEMRLENILKSVSGIGKVQVMITLKSDGRKIVEKDSRISKSESNSESDGNGGTQQENQEETTIYQKDNRGNEVPYISETAEPEVAGVLVAAQGADDMSITGEIIEAVKALFGTEVHKIKVMKMK